MTIWARQDEAAAMREGWYISNSSEGCDEIQRHPWSEIFPSDAEAIAHVYWKAGTGSDLHRRAIAYTLRDGNSWAYERPLRKHKATAEEDEITDIELLPLPEPMRVLGTRGKDAAEAWCRANVALATAAKDAEIERLRSEVELQRELSAQHAREAVFWERKHVDSVSRAERLAEALRELMLNSPGGHSCEDFHHCKSDMHMPGDDCPALLRWNKAVTTAQAALHDHDQEGSDG